MILRRSDLTQLLQRADGDPEAAERILAAVYAELHGLARAQMRGEAAGRTLQTTALVHEAWMRMAGPEGEALAWNSRAHFFGAAAQAMRRILVERARRAGAEKRGGEWDRQPLDGLAEPAAEAGAGAADIDYVALDDALTTLATRDARAALVVDLRYFAGLSAADTAHALGISERTVAREWNVARAYLSNALERGA